MSVRKRPVITVVDARPMDQVGFRDTRAPSGACEIPKLSPPPSKGPPVSRPPPPSNLNSASSPDSDAIYGIPRKPVVSENQMPSDLTNALILDNQLNKSSHPPPPKPRRAGEPRPMTIHFDGQNNNMPLPDRPLHPLGPPVATKRTSFRPEDSAKDDLNQNFPPNSATNDAWNTSDWGRDQSASTKAKPEVIAKRPTIIRVPEAKAESGARPPPVATKTQAAKQHAAKRMSAFDDTPSGCDGFVKPSTKPKPAVRAKPENGVDPDQAGDKPQPITDVVRKRPTIIRPSSVHVTSGVHGLSGANPQSSNSNPTGGPNPAAPNVLPRHFPTSETSENIPAPTRITPTVIHPGFGISGSTTVRPEIPARQHEISTRQQPEIPTQLPEKLVSANASVAPQPKRRPNIIRPSAEVGRKPESTATIASGVVHFSASGTSALPLQQQQQCTGALSDVPPEKQNEENWKRMDDRQSVVPTRPATAPSHDPFGLDVASIKPPQSLGLKQPPSKPPPPRQALSAEVRKQNTSVDSKSQSSESVSHRTSGPPARPAAGPTTKPARPTQPAKRNSSVSEMAPSLPQRPTLGHPLFHYMVTGPHAIALFDYKPTQPDELQFSAGAVILLDKWINSEWLQGRTAQASGMFPCSFVDVIEAPATGSTPTTVLPVASSNTAAEGGTCSASVPGQGPRCCARFDYDGEDPADLAFAAGDIIRLVERVGNEWMKGELNGRVGMFPVGFVEVIEDIPPGLESTNAVQGVSEDGSIVLFDFLGQHGELSLLSGTRVKILGVVNSEWLYGEFEGQKGRFPRNFVDHVPSGLPLVEDQQVQASTHTKVNDGPHCIALYDFVGQNPDDLSFSAGECISLLARVGDDWMEGDLNGRRGIFPASFVQVVKDLDELPPRPNVTPPTDDATLVDTTHSLTAHGVSNVNAEFDLNEKSHSVSSAEKSKQAVAIYDFPGQTEDDLTFHTGEVIEVTGVVDGDWMSGKIGNRVGIFPASFVNILS